jgi:predicted secreted protein
MRRLGVAALALIACSVWAQDNLVSVQAEVSREVANDQLVAVLAAEAHGPDPAALAASINGRMSAALQLARGSPAVKLRSGNYQTFPRYRESRIEAWQASQELRLESVDFTAAAQLIGALQKDLVVRSMAVRLSPEARRAAEDALVPEAIAAFQARADLARKALTAKAYRLRNLSIETAAPGGPPAPFAAMARAQSGSAPPAVEPGVSQVVVTVSGTVQLE